MKKQLPTGAVVAIVVVAVAVLGGLGYIWVNKATAGSAGPSEELQQKQFETQKQLVDGYVKGSNPSSPSGPPASGEAAARAQSGATGQ